MRSAAFAAANPEFADYIAQEFVNHEASPERVKDVAQRWITTESDVRAIAQDVADGSFKFRNIFESAPTTPKGSTMGTRTFASLSSAEDDQIKRIFRKNGTGPTVRAGVRQQYNLSEATTAAYAKVINEAAGKPAERTVTESGSSGRAPGVSQAVYEAAQEYDAALDKGAGEPDLTGLSVGDLQRLSGAVFGPLAFRD